MFAHVVDDFFFLESAHSAVLLCYCTTYIKYEKVAGWGLSRNWEYLKLLETQNEYQVEFIVWESNGNYKQNVNYRIEIGLFMFSKHTIAMGCEEQS